MQKTDITVVIHTHNEEHAIKACIDSARELTKDIVVIDQESTDKTVQIAQSEGVKVVPTTYSQYVEPTRVFGIKQVKSEWLLVLDADEHLSPGLTNEIVQIVENTQNTHFKIPRKNMFGGVKWLKHGGWWPDYQIRLIKKAAFVDWPTAIHSTPIIEGPMGVLKNPLIHLVHGDFEKAW